MVSVIWFQNVEGMRSVPDRENDEKVKTRPTLKRMDTTEVQTRT